MVIWTVDGDGGGRDRVDLFSIFERHVYDRTWRSKYTCGGGGGQGWLLNIWVMLLVGCYSLKLKQKKIGGRKAINLIRDMTSKWRCQ